jgi:hypothetical protein
MLPIFVVQGLGVNQEIPPNSWENVNKITVLTNLILDTKSGWDVTNKWYEFKLAGYYLVQGGIEHLPNAQDGLVRVDIAVKEAVEESFSLRAAGGSPFHADDIALFPTVSYMRHFNIGDRICLSAGTQGCAGTTYVQWANFLQAIFIGC